MHVIDLDNQEIKVTDIDRSIDQAAMFMEYWHEDPHFSDADKQRQKYWTDLHQKLVDLKHQIKT